MNVNRQISELRAVLAAQEIELKKDNEIADKILAEVRAENTKAEGEKAVGIVSLLKSQIKRPKLFLFAF